MFLYSTSAWPGTPAHPELISRYIYHDEKVGQIARLLEPKRQLISVLKYNDSYKRWATDTNHAN